MPVYDGSCHCGAVQFRIAADITDVYRCDCSLCRMKGALMTSVHEDSVTLLSGAEGLSEYNWNTRVARHFFCSKCGIYPFHRKRAMPDHYGVNVHCLTGFDAASNSVRQAEGRGMSVRDAPARDLWTGPRDECTAKKGGGRRESGAYPRILARASLHPQEQTKEKLGRPLRWSYLNLMSLLPNFRGFPWKCGP